MTSAMGEIEGVPPPTRPALAPALAPRGAPLAATGARWLAATAAVAAALVALGSACLEALHPRRPLSPFAPALAVLGVLVALLFWLTLRAEELRLGRELRIARTGTSALRAAALRRRQQGSVLSRLLSTRLGAAAILLAQGDRSDALDALGRRAPLMEGGRLDRLRAIVTADLERESGTSIGLEQCIEILRAMAPMGNREADLYRTHVLVKAILERGDPERGLAVLPELEASRDDEARVYAAWLRVWFDLDGGDGRPPYERHEGSDVHDASWRSLSEGELRRAALLGRAHGADRLVEKLEARLASIAPPVEGE
jgi:hypothetical protein